MPTRVRLPAWTGHSRLRVGAFIPTSGAAGLWGPSCRACAELAAHEINESGGIGGRQVELTFHDAGGRPEAVAATLRSLLAEQAIDAVVGMHTSDVRTALAASLDGTAPYVYTPLYEGNAAAESVLCIGETPERQLLPALDWMSDRYRLRRWFALGNDYVWPRTTHGLVRTHWRGTARGLVGEAYVPFGHLHFDALIEQIRATRADAVLLSLVGADSVAFNRQFARSGLTALRFSCAIEENMLLAVGADSTDGLFTSAGYFAGLSSPANGAFRERYHGRFGDRAPQLNSIGQSMYEGMSCLRGAIESNGDRFGYAGVRTDGLAHGEPSRQPIYLAEATGLGFRIETAFGS